MPQSTFQKFSFERNKENGNIIYIYVFKAHCAREKERFLDGKGTLAK